MTDPKVHHLNVLDGLAEVAAYVETIPGATVRIELIREGLRVVAHAHDRTGDRYESTRIVDWRALREFAGGAALPLRVTVDEAVLALHREMPDLRFER